MTASAAMLSSVFWFGARSAFRSHRSGSITNAVKVKPVSSSSEAVSMKIRFETRVTELNLALLTLFSPNKFNSTLRLVNAVFSLAFGLT